MKQVTLFVAALCTTWAIGQVVQTPNGESFAALAMSAPFTNKTGTEKNLKLGMEKKIIGKWKLESIIDSVGRAVAIKDVYEAEPVYITFNKDGRSNLYEGSDYTGGAWYYSEYSGAYDVTRSGFMGGTVTELWKPISMEKETIVLERKGLNHKWTKVKE